MLLLRSNLSKLKLDKKVVQKTSCSLSFFAKLFFFFFFTEVFFKLILNHTLVLLTSLLDHVDLLSLIFRFVSTSWERTTSPTQETLALASRNTSIWASSTTPALVSMVWTSMWLVHLHFFMHHLLSFAAEIGLLISSICFLTLFL